MYRRLLKFSVIVIAAFWGLAKPDFVAAARSTESKVSPPEDVQNVMNEYLRTVQDKDSNSLEELLCFIDEDDKKLFFMDYSTKDFPEGTAIEYKKASEDCWFVVFDHGSFSTNPFLELWKVDGKWKVLCPTPGRKKFAETKLTRAETYLYMLSEEIKTVQKESDAELQRRRDRYIAVLDLSKRYPLAHQVYYFSGIPNEDANFLAAMPLEKFRQDVILKLDAPDGLRYKIKPSKSTFQEGEPVIVEFIIENVTDKPIKLIFRPGIQVINGSDAETARGALVFPKGQEAGENKNPYMANPDYLLEEREISIRASETSNIEVDLLDYYNLPAAQYSIFSRIDVSKGEKDFWYGYAGTDTKQFKIEAKNNSTNLSELSGILHKGEKTIVPAYLVLDGSSERCYLQGEIIQDIENGAHIYVRGVLHSYLFEHLAGPEVAPPPFRKGWVVYMDVRESKSIKEPFGTGIEQKSIAPEK